MICEIMRTKSEFGNRGDAGDIVGYIFGMTKHDHAADKIDFLCACNIDLPNPTLVLGPNGNLVKINGAEANIDSLVAELDEMSENNPNVDYPFKHLMISLAPGEELSQGQWESVAREFMDRMGYEHCKWISVNHNDTEKSHIHIAANTIQDIPDFPIVNQWQEKVRAMEVLRDLEKRYGLTEVPSPEDAETINHPERQVVKSELRQIIDFVLKCSIDNEEKGLPDFIQSLAFYGVGAKLQMQNGKPKGISYSFKGSSFAGKRLGSAGRYTLPKLFKTGIEYDKARDHVRLELINAEEQARRDGGAPQLRNRRLPPKPVPKHEFSPEEVEALLRPAQAVSEPVSKPIQSSMDSVHERVSFGDNQFWLAVQIPRIQLRRSKHINRSPNSVRVTDKGSSAMLFYLCRNKGEHATAKMIQSGMQLFTQVIEMFDELGFSAGEVSIENDLDAYDKWKEMRSYAHDYPMGLTQAEPEALEQELRELLIGYGGGGGSGSGTDNEPSYAV